MPALDWRPSKAHAGYGASIAPTLATPSGSHAFYLYVKTDPLGLPIAVVNDLLRMKSVTPGGSILDNWLKVTGRDTSHTGYTIYTVVRQSGTAGVFPAGTAVVNYGQSGQGFLFLTSDDTDGPFYSVRTHAGAPWSVQTEVGRFGNLKNSFGVGAVNRFGFAAGDYAGGNYLLYNPTDGFKLKAGAGNVTIDANGVAIATAPTNQTTTAVTWYSGATLVGEVYTTYVAGQSFSSLVAGAKVATDEADVLLVANGTTSGYGFQLVATASNGAGYASLFPFSGTLSGLIIGAASPATAPGAMLDVRGTGIFSNHASVGNYLVLNTDSNANVHIGINAVVESNSLTWNYVNLAAFGNTAARLGLTTGGLRFYRDSTGANPITWSANPNWELTNGPALNFNGTQILTTRRTGYTNAWVTTAAERATARDAATITLVQLAQRVRALQDDLTTHGIIGV